MRCLRNLLLITCLCLTAACARAAEPESATPPDPVQAAAGAPTSAPAAQPKATAVSPQDYLAGFLPKCEGQASLDQPVTFDWPNIQRRMKDLKDGYWAYFSCSNTPAAVVDFYKEKLVEPPYNMVETNWVERQQGFLGLYYYTATASWFYIWVIPQPQDPQKSYAIVVQTDTSLFRPGECRLDPLSARGV